MNSGVADSKICCVTGYKKLSYGWLVEVMYNRDVITALLMCSKLSMPQKKFFFKKLFYERYKSALAKKRVAVLIKYLEPIINGIGEPKFHYSYETQEVCFDRH